MFYLFLFIYTDFNFISPALSVDGTENFNNSVIIPDAPVITVPTEPHNVANAESLALNWSGPVVDRYIVVIDSWDTVSDDGYTATLSGSEKVPPSPRNR